jgi:dipeptidyl aminopeptidase/acylaminoacyl peptidase
VRIWDARTSKCVQAIETRGENINIRWSPDGQHIAVGDKEDNISLIEMRKGKALKNMKFGHEVNEMAWDPTGQLFLLATGSGGVDVFRCESHAAPCLPEPGAGLVRPAHASSHCTTACRRPLSRGCSHPR